MSVLNIFCGKDISRLPDWINLDAVEYDGVDYSGAEFVKHLWGENNPLPFGDGVFSVVYCNQSLEHLTLLEAEKFVVELHRVLEIGGVLTVTVPNIAAHVGDFAWMNAIAYDFGHKVLHTKESVHCLFSPYFHEGGLADDGMNILGVYVKT